MLNNLLPVTLGNIVGGVFFVSIIYYYVYGKESRGRRWSIALVGVGKQGIAMSSNLAFEKNGFHIVGFDVNPDKIGKKVIGVKVYHPYQMPKIIREQKIQIGMIAAPAEAAQESADLLVISGIKGILNFSPTRVVVPSSVKLKNADFTSQLEAIPQSNS